MDLAWNEKSRMTHDLIFHFQEWNVVTAPWWRVTERQPDNVHTCLTAKKWQTHKHAHTHTDTQTDTQGQKHRTDRETDRQTNGKRQRQRDRKMAMHVYGWFDSDIDNNQWKYTQKPNSEKKERKKNTSVTIMTFKRTWVTSWALKTNKKKLSYSFCQKHEINGFV